MNMRKLVKVFIPKSLFKRIEPVGHLLEAIIFNTIHGFPGRELKVIGVTGTNGKTTTSFLIYKMLQESGVKVALNSTVAYGVGDDIRPQMHHMTNVSVPELMKRLKWFKKQGAEWLVLETTSHALAQNRVWGIPYSLSVLTNLTHEHLSYHGTFERYRQAKLKLFKLVSKNKKGLRTGVVNNEDESADMFAAEVPTAIRYGMGGDVYAEDVRLEANGVFFTAVAGEERYQIHCQLAGSFNVSNALATVCVGRALGLTKEQIEVGIAILDSVEGRMTKIEQGQDFDVIVDYAHSPDSFQKLFSDIRPVVKGKIIAVFGSLGGGDVGKRSEQGRIAGQYADEIILTQEDDRKEDPHKIMQDIAEGATAVGMAHNRNLFFIHDRKEAIVSAVSRAKQGDMVLLLGKGHEKTQEDATGEHPWDEIATVRQALQALTDKPK